MTTHPILWRGLQRTKEVVLAVFTLGIIAVAGCGQHKDATAGAPPPPQVTIATVEPRPIVEWEELTGRTAAAEFVEIRPRVSGHVEKVCFDAGQRVRKGQVLFTIDARWHQAEMNRREAEVAMAQVRSDNAEREAHRTAQLLSSKAISREEADAREARFAEARAGLLAATAARDSTRLDLEHTQIRAPIDGRVSRALVTAGNYISGIAGGATLLTTLVSVDPVHVYADLDEAALLRFNALMRARRLPLDSQGRVAVELQLSDESSFSHKGYIESLDNQLDPQTGSIVLRALFSNSDGTIIPGLFARIRFPGSGETSALLVDEVAIGTDQAQKYVLTLTSTNTTAYRAVKLGPVIDGKRVIREGLQSGDRVVVNGLARVRPGMPVTPQEAPTELGELRTARR